MQTSENQLFGVKSTAPLFVDTPTAAEILGLSRSTLEKWRHYRTPGTPPYAIFGLRSVRYSTADLAAWAAQRTKAA